MWWLSLAGSALSAYGQYEQSKADADAALAAGRSQQLQAYAQADNLMAQSAQLDFNARQMGIDAQIALRNAKENARLIRTRGRALTGQQKTRYAISGVRMEGTPLDVLASTIEKYELDAISQNQSGRFASDQLKTRSKFNRTMAKRTRMSASMVAEGGDMTLKGAGSAASGIKKGGTLGAAGTLIDGAVQSYNSM